MRTPCSIDRIAPTRRPPGPPLGYQEWRSLLFLHWEVPIDVLRPLVPPALDLDTHEGRAYVGLVAFSMRNVRPLRWFPPVPGAAHFPQTNVRTYVLHHGQEPGVWFFSLDAASRLAVWGARAVFHLPYFHARMEVGTDGTDLRYRSERQGRDGRLRLRYRLREELPPSEPGSLQFFLTERYYLYAVDWRGRLLRGQVHHRPYPLQRAAVEELDETLLGAAGIRRAQERTMDLYSPGVAVEIFPWRRAPAPVIAPPGPAT